jgi:hypothetical protein
MRDDPYKTPPVRLLVGLKRQSERMTKPPPGWGTLNAFAGYLATRNMAAMVSSNSMWNPKTGRFVPPTGLLSIPAALDSAGFVAMKAGGYKWTPAEYVEHVITAGCERSEGELREFPWLWWSSMDYCVEPKVAGTRARVIERVHQTAETLDEILCLWEEWQHEGDTETPLPVPILQGWRSDDYELSIVLTQQVLASHGLPWPDLVGVGSVCNRHLRGEAGLLRVIPAIHEALPRRATATLASWPPGLRPLDPGEEWDPDWGPEPPGASWDVNLHLFGVKGSAVPSLVKLAPGRIASVDSMAWEFATREDTRKATLAVECPVCYVPPGEPCMDRGHTTEKTHKQRIAAALAAGFPATKTNEVLLRGLDRWVRRQLEYGAIK